MIQVNLNKNTNNNSNKNNNLNKNKQEILFHNNNIRRVLLNTLKRVNYNKFQIILNIYQGSPSINKHYNSQSLRNYSKIMEYTH